jgi:hypothetical protein
MGDEIIDELLGALRYEKSLVNGRGGPASEQALSSTQVPVCTCHAMRSRESD